MTAAAKFSLPIRVRDVMTSAPITVEPTATVREIAHVMRDHDVRFLPVVDVGDVIVGVVGEGDLVRREVSLATGIAELADEKAQGLTAEEIMTTDVVSCLPDEPIGAAARRMLRSLVRVLPVVEGGRLLGVVSRHDLLSLFDRPDSEIRDRLATVLADPLWTPPGHRVETTVHDGVVVLTGSVARERDVGVVVSTVRQVPGVIEVVNRLDVTG